MRRMVRLIRNVGGAHRAPESKLEAKTLLKAAEKAAAKAAIKTAAKAERRAMIRQLSVSEKSQERLTSVQSKPERSTLAERRQENLFQPASIPLISNYGSPDWQADLKGLTGLELVKEDRRQYSRLTRLYGQIISETTALHDHHSLSPGRVDWGDKWQTCKGKRILYFALTDFSGSFYKWAEAVNRHTDHAVRMISLVRHRYGYPLDLLYWRGNSLTERFPEIMNSILGLADEADIIHLKDQTGFYSGKNFLPAHTFSQFRKPTVYTFYGGTARKDETDESFQKYVKSHDAVIAMTPDLCFDWADSVFVPHNVDEDVYPFSWIDGKLIMHTPSTPSRKGTEMFSEAAGKVANEIAGKVEIITGTKHDYIMRHKPLATLFFDQAGQESAANGGKYIGWYGNSALESAVFGVPTMAHLSQEAIDRAIRAGYDVEKESAILNLEPTEKGLYRVMRDFFDMTPRQRNSLARRTRKWIEKHHSYRSTAKKLDALYRSL
jgi:hypothetical protein